MLLGDTPFRHTAEDQSITSLFRHALAGNSESDLMNHACRLVTELQPFDFCAVMLLVPGENRLVVKAGHGWNSGAAEGAELIVHAGSHLGLAVSKRTPALVSDLHHDPGVPELLVRHGVISGIAVPVVVAGTAAGVLAAYASRAMTPTQTQADYLRETAQILGLAMERYQAEKFQAELLMRERQSRQRAEEMERRLRFLTEVTALLANAADYSDALKKLAHLAIPYLADACAVLQLSDDQSLMPIAIAHVDPEKEAPCWRFLQSYQPKPDAPLLSPAALESAQFLPLVTRETLEAMANTPEELQALIDLNFYSYMTVPLIARGRVLGVLALASFGSGRSFGPNDVDLAREVAQHAAVLVDNVRLYESCRHAACQREESLALLNTILSNAPIGFRFLDQNLRTVIINDQLIQFMGIPREQQLDRPVWELYPQFGPTLEAGLRYILEAGTPVLNQEITIEQEAGDPTHFLINVYPVSTPVGKRLGVGLLVTDISERRHMEQELRDRQSLLSGQTSILEKIATRRPLSEVLSAIAAFAEDHIPDSVCAVMLLKETEGNLHVGGARCLPEACLSLIDKAPVGPDSSPCGTAAYSKQQVVVPDLGGYDRWPDGRELAANHGLRAVWSTPILASDGDVLGTMAIYNSCVGPPTEKDQKMVQLSCALALIAIAQDRVEEARSLKLQSLIEHMNDGVIALDEDRRVLVVNPAARQLLSLPEFKEPQAFGLADFPPALSEALRRAISPGSRSALRVTLPCGDILVQAHISPVANELAHFGAVAVLRDVKEKERFRMLQETFVANVSHELRGPLASMSAIIEALNDGLLPQSEHRRYFQVLLSEISRLGRLTQDLLTLSKLDAEAAALSEQRFEVGDLFQTVREKWGPRFDQAQVSLHVAPPAKLWVTGIHDRVEQVLAAFLENALRCTPPGGAVRLFATCQEDRASLHVADTGIGIAGEHLPYIWERFYKVDQARSLLPDSGTGLGLSIAKEIVLRMGGDVRVESEHGKGSTFSFTLPLAVRS